IPVAQGATVSVGAILGAIAEGAAGKTSAVAASNPQAARPTPAAEAPKPAPAPKAEAPAMPSAQRIAAESGIATASVAGTGRDGRVTKGDMLGALAARAAAPAAATPVAASPRHNE